MIRYATKRDRRNSSKWDPSTSLSAHYMFKTSSPERGKEKSKPTWIKLVQCNFIMKTTGNGNRVCDKLN